jgi:polysaccharide export outer membrane protein
VQFYGVDADEIVNKPYRIGPDGQISLPLVGRIQVAGITLRELEDAVNDRLKTFIQDPQLVANVLEFRSQPVSVIGAVNQAGTLQLQGQRTLLEMISLAGGLRQDAGYSIRITRMLEWGELPLPNARPDSTGKFSVAEVNLRELLAARRPTDNIQILPHDVITVPQAEMVFVLGDVGRSGSYLLADRQTMSVVEAVSMAEGLTRTADSRNCRILRVVTEQAARREIPVDIKAILAGKAEDVPLRAGDILFVPGSVSKTIGLRTAEGIIQVATGLAIWGRR